MKDSELLKTVKSFTKGLLYSADSAYMCYAICLPLQAYLSIFKIETELIEGEIQCPDGLYQHYWLKLDDDRILDPTADQFNEKLNISLPAVYLDEIPEHYNIYDATQANR